MQSCYICNANAARRSKLPGPADTLNWLFWGIAFSIWIPLLVWVIFAGLGGQAIKGSLLYLGIPVGIPIFSFVTLYMIFASCCPSDSQRTWWAQHIRAHRGESPGDTGLSTTGGYRSSGSPVSPEEYYTSLP